MSLRKLLSHWIDRCHGVRGRYDHGDQWAVIVCGMRGGIVPLDDRRVLLLAVPGWKLLPGALGQPDDVQPRILHFRRQPGQLHAMPRGLVSDREWPDVVHPVSGR